MLNLIRGRRTMPDAVLVLGVEGVGKTTFGAAAPAPVFICSEDGLGLLEVPRFPVPKRFEDVLGFVVSLRKEKHEFRTLVIDSLDWLEPLVWAAACERNGWKDIEAPGYGKGYVVANEFWRLLKLELDTLRDSVGMQVVLLAHTAIRTFANPAGPDYSRFEPALQKGAAALWCQWADSILFAEFQDVVKKDGLKAKASSSGRRIVHTVRSAGWTAKTRWALPPVLSLDWDEYEGFRDARAEPADLVAACGEVLAAISDKSVKEKAGAFIVKNADNPKKMAALLERLRATLETETEG